MTALQVPVPGGTLAAEVAGRGPEVVLLHGFALDMTSWDAVFADLIRDHRVLRYDLRGFGSSSLPDGPYDHREDLLAVIRAAGFSNPAVVGLSLGGNIALRHGLESDPPPPAVILCSPGLAGHEWNEPRPPDQARAIAQQDGADAARAFWLAHPLFAPLRAAGHGPALERMVATYSGFHWQGADPQHAAPAPIPLLAQARFAALILSGGLDVAGYREIADRLAATLPQATLIRMEEAGHMLAMERPEATASAIRRFLTDTATERSRA